MIDLFDNPINVDTFVSLSNINGYDIRLVVLSYGLAVAGSYISIIFLNPSRIFSETLKKISLFVGSATLATAVCATQIIALLSFNFQQNYTFSFLMVLASFLSILAPSLMMFALLHKSHFEWGRILPAALILSLGVNVAQYVGISSLIIKAKILFSVSTIIASFGLTAIVSLVAFWIMNQVIEIKSYQKLFSFISALILGIAICGTQYFSMSSIAFYIDPSSMNALYTDCTSTALIVASGAVIIFSLASLFLIFGQQSLLADELNQEYTTFSRMQTSSLILKFLVILGIGFFAYTSRNTISKSLDELSSSHLTYHHVRYLGESITMTAQLAATTGDSQWINRFHALASQLEAAVSKVKDSPDESFDNLAQRLKDSSQHVVAYQNEAIDLAVQGKNKDALSILTSEPYIDNLNKFENASEQLREKTHVEEERIIKSRRKEIDGLIVLLLPTIVAFIFGVSCIIRGRRLLNHAIRDKEFTSVIMNTIQDPIFVKDSDKNWKDGNKAFWNLLRGDSKDQQNSKDFAPLSPQNIIWLNENDDKVINSDFIDDRDGTLFRTSAQRVYVTVKKIPLKLSNGESGLVGIIHDVTALKIAEKELKEHRDNLQKLVDDQTRIMRRDREQLKIAKDEAERASSTKSDFLANMSHEIRTPLNSIIGMTELLLESPVSDNQKDMLNTMSESSWGLLEIVNDILDLSKIESGHLILEQIPFNPAHCVKRVVTMLNPVANKKGLTLEIVGDMSEPDSLIGDPTRYTRVITNIVGNAIKYTESGSIKVKYSSLSPTESTREVRVDVIDTGIGIQHDKIKGIFEKFIQADETITRKYGGTGLGLSITKQLVDMMNGTIEVESEVGVGSRFSVVISFQITHSQTFDDLVTENPPEPIGTIPVEDVKILIAEDHELNKAFMRRLLPNMGVRYFTFVENGKEAYDKAISGEFDMVLMDCHMPVLSGYESTKDIRTYEAAHGKHIPIIAMTANAMTGEKEKCLACGMDDYISKPVERQKLKKVLAQWIKFESVIDIQPSSLQNQMEEASLDLAVLKTLCDGNDTLMKELAFAFTTQSALQLDELKKYCQNEFHPEWVEYAHMLKGAAASTIGAKLMRDLCTEAQMMTVANATDRERIYTKIRNEYLEVVNELKSHQIVH